MGTECQYGYFTTYEMDVFGHEVVETPDEPTPEAPVEVPLAPGTAGELKLYDTPPKTAAMLMAIVADKMGKPLNELRFISIKEVK